MVDQTHRKAGIAIDHENRSPNDFYPTSREASTALLTRERFAHQIEEPACGDGALSRVLTEFGYFVYSSDLHDYGYGTTGVDFLKRQNRAAWDMVTNPPFGLWHKFAAKAIELDYHKFALFGRVNTLAGQNSGRLFKLRPLARVYIFSRRLHERRPGYEGPDKPVQDLAWYVWDRTHEGAPELKFVDWKE